MPHPADPLLERPTPPRRRLPTGLRPLSHVNYRRFFFAQSISLLGIHMHRAALLWLVLTLTDDALLVGLASSCSLLPSLPLAPLAGVLADRFPKRRILLATQGLAMLQALALGTLLVAGVRDAGVVIGLALLSGCIQAFDVPTRHAFIVETIGDRADLPGAITMNATLFNITRTFGGWAAGAAMAYYSEAACFYINAATYLPVLVALASLRLARRPLEGAHEGIFERLAGGFRYVRERPPIRATLMMLGLTAVAAMSHGALMPVMARHGLGGDEQVYGRLFAVSGFGAMLMAAWLTMHPRQGPRLAPFIPLGAMVTGTTLMTFSQVHSVWAAYPLLFVLGCSLMFQIAATNTSLQSVVNDSQRGRVMSYYTMMLLGMIPVGDLLVGALTKSLNGWAGVANPAWGARWTLLGGGALMLLGGLVLSRGIAAMRDLPAGGGGGDLEGTLAASADSC